jgi:CRISPR-associated protein Csd1
MSILSALARAYDRLKDAPPYGYSPEKISYVIGLNADGSVASVSDIRDGEGKKRTPRLLLAPQGVKRTVGIAPNFLWDKTAYVLGVTAGEGKRTAQEHAAFVKRHLEALDGSEDEGLRALRSFLAGWTPEAFQPPLWPEEMKDQNVVFALESERLATVFLHDRPATREIWARIGAEGAGQEIRCLVSGERGPLAMLHPSIKGVWGAQTAGASIVSFNLDAFTSYGHEQGENAPISEASAFKYTTALNAFLAKGSGHRLQIGDASVVFWAEADERAREIMAEQIFSAMLSDLDTTEEAELDTQVDAALAEGETESARRVSDKLKLIKQGLPLVRIAPDLAEGVRFYVLALAPNAARLSIRFWLDNDFGVLADNYRRYLDDMRLEPMPPHLVGAPFWRCLSEVAVLGKRENVPPHLAGEWARAMLTGTPYPHSLLASVLMRLRADREVTPLRVAILRAILSRNCQMEVPVALDAENTRKGYLLGRLFAVYEEVQRAALGKVNASIKDKFYGSASAQPRSVFALLDKGSANHLAKAGKVSPGRKVNLEKKIAAIMDMMSPDEDPFPSSLPVEDQALFGLGYYHQRAEFFTSATKTAAEEENAQ